MYGEEYSCLPDETAEECRLRIERLRRQKMQAQQMRQRPPPGAMSAAMKAIPEGAESASGGDSSVGGLGWMAQMVGGMKALEAIGDEYNIGPSNQANVYQKIGKKLGKIFDPEEWF
jgi:hypothetical protein